MTLANILLYALLGSVGAVSLAALILLLKERWIERLLPHLISYAIGTLLGASLLRMIPHALTHLPGRTAMGTVLVGLVAFFLLESVLLYRHCHEPHCPVHSHGGTLILIGDAVHNLLDGLVIASAFLTSAPVGAMAGLAVIAHEIPQEIGDFGVLLHSGFSRKRAFFFNLLSSASTLAGALGGYFALTRLRPLIPYVVCISAASFLYVALADLIPERRQRKRAGEIAVELLIMAAGIITIAGLTGGH